MFNSLAVLSATMPFEVEIIAIPSPFRTVGRASALAYFRKPGLLILLIPVDYGFPIGTIFQSLWSMCPELPLQDT